MLPLTVFLIIILNGWAVSSAGERLLDEEKVVGSTPTPPTIFYYFGFSQSIFISI